MKLIAFKDESKLPELIDWVRQNTSNSVIVVLPGEATRFGDPVVLHWYNKQGDIWTQDKPAAQDAAKRLSAAAQVHIEAEDHPNWFAKLEWHFESDGEGMMAKLACG